MKKKLMFMVINMNVGGTEKALLNMIAEIPRNEYEITILMLEKYGGYLNFIPEDVSVEYINDYQNMKQSLNKSPRQIIIDNIKKKNMYISLNLIFYHTIGMLRGERTLFFKYLLKNTPVSETKYDIAVAYAGPMDFISYFILKKIRSKIKIQWIHFDVTKVGFNPKFANKIYRKFQQVFVVSDSSRSKLVDLVPAIEKKTKTFVNIISPKVIEDQSDKGLGFKDIEFDGLRILTVGRLSPEKGQDLAIRVLALLIQRGYNVKWYCLGEGKYREYYEELIIELGLENHFILLGLDTNPYTYMKQCDVYVQPSRYEGYCITLAEARQLSKPIITTDFAGAREQLINGETGIIVNDTIGDIFNAVEKLIIDIKLRNYFTANLSKYPCEVSDGMNQFLNISNH